MLSFLIITHVPHIQLGEQYYAYAPYVREMNIWLKYVDKVVIVAPKCIDSVTKIEAPYLHHNIELISLDSFNLLNIASISKACYSIPHNFLILLKAFRKADHIHLRCPGNIGLLGAVAQVLFPSKKKTAKYAGNWDPTAKAPLSYKLQKAILANTYFTRNIQVLVYGNWKNTTKNIKPFFTATYKETDKEAVVAKELKNTIKFIFVGMLTVGKQPLYALQLVENLNQLGHNVELCFYGEGIQRTSLERYILEKKLNNFIFLKGNQDLETIKEAYQQSHFVILPSVSEGWPKVVAEGMFWGCVPVATKVSCVPDMLDYGARGVLLDLEILKDSTKIQALIANNEAYKTMRQDAVKWSRKYTLDYFEQEIKLLLNQ